MMIKEGYHQVVHGGGAIDHMMQPHEPTHDHSYASTLGSIQHPSPPSMMSNINVNTINAKPLNMEARNNKRSEWVEQITRQIIDNDLPIQFSPPSSTTCHGTNNNCIGFQATTSGMRTHDPIALLSGTTSSTTSDDHDFVRPSKSVKTLTSSFCSTPLQYHPYNYSQWNNSSGIMPIFGKNFEESTNTNSTSSCSEVDENGIKLLSQLLECAVAISLNNLSEAKWMLLELTQMASPYSPSCAERVVAYFAKAMWSRVINSWLGISSPLIEYKTIHSSFQAFSNISPFVKFAHFTSNQAILEAFQRSSRVHIIDVDIMQGLQWPALFHILTTRLEGPPHVTMTGMGSSLELLLKTGKQLSNFAKRLNLPFEFHPIAKKFGEVEQYMLPIRRGETLAVHWLQHSLYDATGPDWKTMRLLEELSPRVITLVEQDISHDRNNNSSINGGSFLDRFVSSLYYYSTMFDSIGAYLTSDNDTRHQVEHNLFYREINRVLAIGGPSRSGELRDHNCKFKESWRNELDKRSGSFVKVPMSANSLAQAHLMVNMFLPNHYPHGFSLQQSDDTLRVGWKDTCLLIASAWTTTTTHFSTHTY